MLHKAVLFPDSQQSKEREMSLDLQMLLFVFTTSIQKLDRQIYESGSYLH